MPRGEKSSYTDKQKRQAEHIEDSYEDRGVPRDEAEERAWRTVNKQDHGGKKSGGGRETSSRKSSATRKSSSAKKSATKKSGTRKSSRKRAGRSRSRS